MEKKLQILFVEDIKHDYVAMNRALDKSELECKTIWVQQGKDAIQNLQSGSVDIVLIDYKLPDENGLELFKKIKKHKLNIPVVFVAASGNESIAAEAIKLGAQDYIVKDPLGRYLEIIPDVIKKALTQWKIEQEQKISAEKLRRSEERFRAIFETAQDSIFIKDKSLKYTQVNPAMERLFGLPALRLIEMTDDELFGKEGGAYIRETDYRVLNGEIIEDEHTKPVKGVMKTFHLVKIPMHDNTGKVTGLYGIARDITERKKAEQIQSVLYHIADAVNTTSNLDELYKLIHIQLGTIVDTTNFYIALYDEKSNIITAPYYVDQLKKNIPQPQQLKNGLTAYVIHTAKHLYLTVEKREKLMKEGKIAQADWKSKIWIGVPLRNENKVIGALAVQSYTNASLYTENDMKILEFVSDAITLAINRKTAEEKLRDERDKAQKYLDVAGVILLVLDANQNVVLINRKGCKILGYKETEIVGKNWFDNFLLEEIREGVRNVFKKLIAGEKKPDEHFENVILTKDGNERIVAWYDSLLTDENGNIIGTLSSGEDITERKKAEKALKEKERFHRVLLDDMVSFVAVLKPDGEVIFVNNTPLKVGGLKLEDVVGKKFYDCDWWTHSDEVQQTVKKYVEQCACGKTLIYDIQIQIADGSLMWVEYSMHPCYDENDSVKYLIPEGRNITERKHAEKIQKALYDISNALNTTDKMHDLYSKIRECLGNVIDTTNFYVALYDKETGIISLPYMVDEKKVFTSFPSGKTLTDYVIRTGKPLLADEKVLERLSQGGEAETIGPLSKIWLGVPLKIENEVIGSITVQSYTDASLYTEKDMKILEFVSGQIAIAIERKQSEENLKNAYKELQKRLHELEIFHKATMGREGRIIELKREINTLLERLGEEKRFGV